MDLMVLIVDDNKINVTLLEVLLKQISVSYNSFTDPLQAFEYCENSSNNIDLLIVDHMMPKLLGLDFIKQFRQIDYRAETPIIMITAEQENEIKYQALEAGANDFLTKPLDKIELTSRVKNMLNLRKAQLALMDKAAWLSREIDLATKTIRAREQEAIFSLCKASEFRDLETGHHILRMAKYSRAIAKALKLSESDCELIFQSSPMHDIGKVGIADYILLKPGKLTPEEFEVMKTHSKIGYEILQSSTSEIMKHGAEIALHHHEKYDGSGYPDALSKDDIPVFARIVALADVFDALTSTRPYKPAWEVDIAVEHIKQSSGSHFDPKVVDAFLNCLDEILEIHSRLKD